jgi:plastocyanin
MKKWIRSVVLLIAAAAVMSGSVKRRDSSAAAPPPASEDQLPASAEVKIDNFSFNPATVSVAMGGTVTWTNRDDIPHTVVSSDKVFKSKVLDTDEKFSYTFTKAGNYSYFCSIHPKMTGTVVVK